MDPALGLTPFIFFSRRLQKARRRRIFADQPGMRRLYGLWRQLEGTSTIAGEDGGQDLRPDGIGLTEPGMQLTMHAGARVVYTAFALLPRRRLVYGPGKKITFDLDEPAEPSWRELFGRRLPALVPEPVAFEARRLADAVAMTYWRSPAHRFADSCRLASWLIDFSAEDPALAETDNLVQRCDDLIALRYPDPITVADLAGALGVSTAHLNRRYRRSRSCAPGEALRRERIAQACKLLRETTVPVAQVAVRVGFRDPSSFVRSFRQLVGQTPRRWRQARMREP
ncbi:MAG: helix-turn-helix domain-containing protein [Rhodosalinus sp.]